MITVANPVGRLCVARFVPPFDVGQVDKLAAEVEASLVRAWTCKRSMIGRVGGA